ncbi:NAD-P-binding protein [Mycena latifolia]|nr:NAD-P-binding protein [Mycena latifolia]
MSVFSQIFVPRAIPPSAWALWNLTDEQALLEHGAKVYIAGRSQTKAEERMALLRQATGKNDLHFLELDLADLAAVKKAAETYLSLETQLHVLFNNGGLMQPPLDQFTAQGYDLQFGTNVLGESKVLIYLKGHFYFTTLLLPILLATAKTSHVGKARVGNVVFSAELARQYGAQGLSDPILPMGALTQLYAGTTAAGAELNGKYLIPWARIGTANPLWTWLEEQVASVP